MAIQQPPPVLRTAFPQDGGGKSDHELLQGLVNAAVLAESSNEV
jgi:hypothetical protein